VLAQHVARHGCAGTQDQDAEEPLLALAADRQDAAVIDDPDRAQDLELHPPLGR
jgi:hypothetical protein